MEPIWNPLGGLSIPVVLGLVRPLRRHADVSGMLVGEGGELGVELLLLRPGYLIEGVHAHRVLVGLGNISIRAMV
jgi:hypothetical protein